MSAAGVRTVAKKQPTPPESPDPDRMTTVKMRTDLHRRLRTLASYNGEELADYLDQILRPIVSGLWTQMGSEIKEDE